MAKGAELNALIIKPLVATADNELIRTTADKKRLKELCTEGQELGAVLLAHKRTGSLGGASSRSALGKRAAPSQDDDEPPATRAQFGQILRNLDQLTEMTSDINQRLYDVEQ